MCSYNINICRICMDTNTNLTNIFSSTLTISSISTAIMECAPISISETDTLPHQICTCCLDKLEIAYNFRILCIQTDQTLRNNVSCTVVKEEKDEKLTITPVTTVETVLDIGEIKIEKNENLYTDCLSDNDRISDNDQGDITTTAKKLNVKKIVKKPSKTKLKRRQSKSTKVVLVRENDGYFHCEQCPKTYKDKKVFKSHLISHTSFRFSCDKCDKKFYNKQNFKRHIDIVHATERKYNCEFCGKTFRSWAMLRIHHKSHSTVREFKCEICAKEFKLNRTLKKHYIVHKDVKPFVCGKCGKSFKRKEGLTTHEKIHDGKRVIIPRLKREIEPKRKCEHCDSVFRTSSDLRNHQRTHSTLREFKCDICTKDFKYPTSFKRHMVTHNDERPFVCGECGSSFKRKDHLTVHELLHSGDKLFKCIDCGQAFQTKQSMNSHLLKGCLQLS